MNVQPPKPQRPFIGLLGVVVGALWLMTCGVYVAAWLSADDRAYLTDLRDRTSTQALDVAERLDDNTRGMRNVAESFAEQPEAIALLRHRLADTRVLSGLDEGHRRARLSADPEVMAISRYYRQVADDSHFNLVVLFDRQGTCVATSAWRGDPASLGLRYGDRAYFQDALKVGDGWQFAVGRRLPAPSFFFARAVRAGGHTLGVAVIRQSVGALAKTLASSGDETLVADANGVIVASNRVDLVLRRVALWSRAPRASASSDYGPSALKAMVIQPVAREGAFNLVTWNGARYLAASHKVAEVPLTVWILAPVVAPRGAKGSLIVTGVLAALGGLLALVAVDGALARVRARRAHAAELAAANAALTLANARLTTIAGTDPLTGCSNRRHFIERVGESLAAARRGGGPRALIIIDLDQFKRINDTHGHPVGDIVLATVARTCLEIARATDVFGRIGGEEFALFLWDTDAAGARLVAERLRKAIEALRICHGAKTIGVTASLGVAQVAPAEDFDAVFARADAALYAAKAAGRNRLS